MHKCITVNIYIYGENRIIKDNKLFYRKYKQTQFMLAKQYKRSLNYKMVPNI